MILRAYVAQLLQVASYMRAVLRTLAQCHAHRILHRDIKPGNFMLLTEAEDSPLKAIGKKSKVGSCGVLAVCGGPWGGEGGKAGRLLLEERVSATRCIGRGG